MSSSKCLLLINGRLNTETGNGWQKINCGFDLAFLPSKFRTTQLVCTCSTQQIKKLPNTNLHRFLLWNTHATVQNMIAGISQHCKKTKESWKLYSVPNRTRQAFLEVIHNFWTDSTVKKICYFSLAFPSFNFLLVSYVTKHPGSLKYILFQPKHNCRTLVAVDLPWFLLIVGIQTTHFLKLQCWQHF